MKTLPTLMLITDSKRVDPVAAAKKLPPDSGIILRDYDLSYDERLKLGRKIKKAVAGKNIIFLVAKDIRLATELNADGVHLPEFMHGQIGRIKSFNKQWLVTIAAHSRIAAQLAFDKKADAVMISPLFETASHPGKDGIGVLRAKNYIKKGIFTYALGGVKPRDVKIAKTLGFQGVAGISLVTNCG